MYLVLWFFACFASTIAKGIPHHSEGVVCKDGPPPWHCKLQTDCSTLLGTAKGSQIQLCSSNGNNTQMICCPPSVTLETTKHRQTTNRTKHRTGRRRSRTNRRKTSSKKSKSERSEGVVCKDGPPPWHCKLQRDCPALMGTAKGSQIQLCSSKGNNTQMVCCPPSVTLQTTTPRLTTNQTKHPTSGRRTGTNRRKTSAKKSKPVRSEGAVCKDGPPPWHCKLQADCPALMGTAKGSQIQLCSSKGNNTHMVCCPPSVTLQTTTPRLTTNQTKQPSRKRPTSTIRPKTSTVKPKPEISEGGICKDGPPPWHCKLQADCPALMGTAKGSQTSLCTSKGNNTRMICCPPTVSLQTTTPRLATNKTKSPTRKRPTSTSRPKTSTVKPKPEISEGGVCKDGPPPWHCKLQADCPALTGTAKRSQIQLCSSKGNNTQMVCCPPSLTLQTTTPRLTTNQTTHPTRKRPTSTSRPKPPPKESKARKKCKDYAKYVGKPQAVQSGKDEKVASCGMSSTTRIAGVEKAGPREFPHMARIGYGEENNITWKCGGSLISMRYILSAAHCTEPKINEPAKWANLGDLDVSTDTDDAAPVTIKIIARINYPKYQREEKYHDIALYKLKKMPPLGIYIRPICLNTRKTIRQRRAIASGWGVTEWGATNLSLNLHKVDLDLIPAATCNDAYRKHVTALPQGISSDSMICAGGGGKDTAPGDSGGPLQVALKKPYCMYSIIGVTSFGKEEAPGVYTKVSHYVKWIEGIVWPSKPKPKMVKKQ